MHITNNKTKFDNRVKRELFRFAMIGEFALAVLGYTAMEHDNNEEVYEAEKLIKKWLESCEDSFIEPEWWERLYVMAEYIAKQNEYMELQLKRSYESIKALAGYYDVLEKEYLEAKKEESNNA